VIYHVPQDPDLTARRKREDGVTAERRRRGTGGSRSHSDLDLGVLFDGEAQNDVQLEVVEAMAKQCLQNRPAAMMGGDWRLVL
jgi:hypothetical protein